MNDTERLDFLIRYFRVEDVGDETVILGVSVRDEDLESDLSTCGPIEWESDMRMIIDRAILQEREP